MKKAGWYLWNGWQRAQVFINRSNKKARDAYHRGLFVCKFNLTAHKNYYFIAAFSIPASLRKRAASPCILLNSIIIGACPHHQETSCCACAVPL
jgi:hypothetical protein